MPDSPPRFPNLRHMRLLQVAAAMNSLTAAAAAVGISQPAASQAMAKLDRLYGGPLLIRRGNGVQTTPKGKIVAARTKRALSFLRSASRMLSGRPRVGALARTNRLEAHTTISHLRTLAAFAEAGSFSAAARQLGLAEPSVQRAAREMERIAGVPLFDESERHLRLTVKGERLASYAGLVLKELEAAYAEAREFGGSFDSKVVVGALPLMRTRIVPDAAVMLSEQRQDARIEIIDGAYEDLIPGLMMGRIDMLVGALRQGPLERGVVQEELFTDEVSIIARKDHPLSRLAADGMCLDELARFPWVLPRKGTPTRVMFDAMSRHFPEGWLAQSGIIETSSLSVLRGILLRSDRLALLSRRQLAYEEAESDQLSIVPFDLGLAARSIGITRRANWQPTVLQHEFVDALRAVSYRLMQEENHGEYFSAPESDIQAARSSSKEGAARHPGGIPAP